MFQHNVYSLTNRQPGLFAYVKTCKTRLVTTTKFMVVVTLLFNLVISSFPDNMLYHVWTTLFKSVRSSSGHEQLSIPTCMNKPVNNTVQAGQLNHIQTGQLNHVQACQQAKTRCAFLRVIIVGATDRWFVSQHRLRSTLRYTFYHNIPFSCFFSIFLIPNSLPSFSLNHTSNSSPLGTSFTTEQ